MRFFAVRLGVVVLPIFVGCGGGASGDSQPAPAGSTDGSRAPASAAPAPTSSSRPVADPGKVALGAPLYRATASAGDFAKYTLDDATAQSDGSLVITAGSGHASTDPQPTGYKGGAFYNGGSFRYATVTSPVIPITAPFDSVTPSFEASTPAGTWIQVKLAARIAGTWTKDYSLGVWASDTSTVRRHSVTGQVDDNGDVDTDTLTLTKTADALRISVLLYSQADATSPSLRAISAIATKRGAAATPLAADQAAWGKLLDVPKRSQMIYPNGGEVWCSPTSTSMLLAYWGATLAAPALVETPPQAAAACQDVTYSGTGNWPFNTAHASSIDNGRLHGLVTRLSSFAEVERLIGGGIPVAISVSYGANELDHSPITSTGGHLIVVRGFAANGDVVCNDPAFPSDASVEVTYDRAQLTQAWQHSMGTTYVVWPSNQALPADPLGHF